MPTYVTLVVAPCYGLQVCMPEHKVEVVHVPSGKNTMSTTVANFTHMHVLVSWLMD